MHLSRLLACLFLMCAIAHGQSVSASLKGRVVDPAKANIAGAAALLSHTETGARLKAATNADGLFVFPAVAHRGVRVRSAV